LILRRALSHFLLQGAPLTKPPSHLLLSRACSFLSRIRFFLEDDLRRSTLLADPPIG
jgi:hypothetical protein